MNPGTLPAPPPTTDLAGVARLVERIGTATLAVANSPPAPRKLRHRAPTDIARLAPVAVFAAILADEAERIALDATPITRWLAGPSPTAAWRNLHTHARDCWPEIRAESDGETGANATANLPENLPVEWLGMAYEQTTARPLRIGADGRFVLGHSTANRKQAGRFFTPPDFAARIARATVAPLLDAGQAPAELRAVDPACGAGAFLFALLRGFLEFDPATDVAAVARHTLHGVDRDALAVGICRSLMWLVAGPHDAHPADIEANIRVGNALIGPPMPDAVAPPKVPAILAGEWFDWTREFPRIFAPDSARQSARPAGFDVVVGNPPWDKIKAFAREFFADRRPELARLSRRDFDAAVAEWLAADENLAADWHAHQTHAAATARFLRESGAFRRLGRGDPNTFKVFLERALQLVAPGGRIGLVLPYSFCIDLGATELRREIFENCRPVAIEVFDNRGRVFGISSVVNFVSLTCHAPSPAASGPIVQRVDGREFAISLPLLKLVAPDSASVPQVAHPRDVAILEKIYAGAPLLGGGGAPGPLAVRFRREFDMTLDRHKFNTTGVGVPIFEGKMIHQFRLDWAGQPLRKPPKAGATAWIRESPPLSPDGLPMPRFWISPATWPLPGDFGFRCAVRLIQNSRNRRTLIATLLPPGVAAGNSLGTAEFSPPPAADDGDIIADLRRHLWLAGVLNSHVLDWVARLKIDANLNVFHLLQLPMPGADSATIIGPRVLAILLANAPRVFAPLRDRVTAPRDAWSREFARVASRDAGALTAEIGAAVARAFGLPRRDLQHILGTFPRDDTALKAAVDATFSANPKTASRAKRPAIS